ncbi:unnamed protein product [Mycena citricolor]|uniref:CSC1/OSCA1-like 7TM region domain-containing protein n=1 Tax=Mycena citricolor TaxID=2018698 RepID=A0AAD2HA38_9AGAR|nr:unnamed protein product [Mycena citricolor]
MAVSGHQLWWTTSNGSVFIPSKTSSSTSTTESASDEHSQSSVRSTSPASASSTSSPLTSFTTSSPASSVSTTNTIPTVPASGVISSLTTFTTTFPTTITQPTTTFTSLAESVVVTTAATTTIPANQALASSNPVCIGAGTDSSTDGVLASLILPSVIGLLIWILFAVLRPRFRQVYALREWFVEQGLRPQPLSSSFFAFLHPPVPLIPPVPSDVSDMGRSPAEDAALFPSDEQLSQRAVWIALLIVLGWAFLGLVGALPLYMVSTPCLADGNSPAVFGGQYSTLEDLSLLRLLRAVEAHNISSQNLLASRAVVAGAGDPQNLRVRLIVLTVLVIVIGLLPSLYKIVKELRRLISFRQRWLEYRCQGKQLGWLSAKDARGFAGWGEQRFKTFLATNGMSSVFQSGSQAQRRSPPRDGSAHEPDAESYEVDVTNLYSICDTQRLALLIDERDEILENLELAETRYISSFRLTTPDPSVLDFEPRSAPEGEDPSRPYISHPLPLRNQTVTRRPRRKRSLNPAFAASSLAPRSFVAPSVYYKLNRVHGVSGGQFGGEGALNGSTNGRQSLAQSINSRLVGSRFQEMNRNSGFGHVPLGSHVQVGSSGDLRPIDEHGFLNIPDPTRYGPNQTVEDLLNGEDKEWVDVETEHHPRADETEHNGPVPGASKRETFPFRRQQSSINPDTVAPPHLRLQPSQPFVRPNDGLDFEHLGSVYADISQWRTRLKAINVEISEAQTTGYEDIAGGVHIKGWLMIGRGLRFIPGMQIIEGMAKEDVRWDVLQNERGPLDSVVLWSLLIVASVLLMAGLTAAVGLSLVNAPNVAHYLPFLAPLLTANSIASGLATVLAPAVAGTLFICLAMVIINYASQIRGNVSRSSTQLFVFQLTFYILFGIGAIWLITVGALIYALQQFNTGPGRSTSVADGSIYMAILALSVIFTAAIIFPGFLLLQPFRLWHVLKAEKRAITPRQKFRAIYPRTYNPAFAIGACILAIIFASTFSLIFPLIAPAVVLLLFLTLVAHRFLVGYVYARTHSQTGGLLQIWLLRRFGTLLGLQPILLGLIYLSRRFWIEGGVLVGVGFFVVALVEIYTIVRTRLPSRRSLSGITRDSLSKFEAAARASKLKTVDDETVSVVGSSARLGGHRTRGSMASVLEMMSVTLAVMPPRQPEKVSLPLSESLVPIVQSHNVLTRLRN